MADKKFETLDGINSQGDVTISGNLAVDTNVLFVNSSTNKVGIGTTSPASELQVSGTITATAFSGNGSGLSNIDATTLDSIDSTQFLRSDTSDSFTSGSFTFSGSAVTVNSGNLRLSSGIPLRFGSSDTPGVNMTFNPNELQVNGSNVDFDSGTLFINTGLNRVGIGTNEPSTQLDVNGTVTATQFSGGSSNLSAVTTSVAGVMTAADKIKLNGIATGAQVNVPTNLGYTASTRILTSSTGTNTTLPQVTTSADGLMIAADKTKLNGIEAGAQVNVPTNLGTSATSTTRTVTSSTGTNVTLPAVTTSAAGVMTATDKSKLNGIASGAQPGTVTSVGSGTGLVGGPISTTGTLSLAIITAGNTNPGALNYNGQVRGPGRLYGGTTNPQSTTRLNYDGILHATDVIATSDRGLKKDIADLPSEVCLNIVNSLRPRSYRWKEDNREDHGLIAQEVQEFAPLQTPNGTSINYAKLTTYLLGAVQAQQKTIETLNERIQKLEESE